MERKTVVMEKIACHSEPITKGFEFCWTIDHFPLELTGVKRSPVFEALSKRWVIQTQFHSINGLSDYLDVILSVVNKDGNVSAAIGGDEDDPILNAPFFRAKISFCDDKGEALISNQVLTKKGPLKQHLNNVLAPFSIHNSRLQAIIRAGEIKRFQLLFELTLMVGTNEVVHNNFSAPIANLEKLFDEGKFSDFLIRTGDGREIHAHRLILSMSSTYFEALFNSGEIEVPEPFPVMNAIIRFLYSGKLLEIGADLCVVGLYIAADKYQITGIKDYIEKFAEKHFSVGSVCAELLLAHTHGVERMKAKAADFIRAHQSQLSGTEGWRELCREHPHLVVYLLAPKAILKKKVVKK